MSRQEFVRSLLTEDGWIDINHAIFEEAKHPSEKTRIQVIADVIEKVSWDDLLCYLSPEEIIKNMKYFSYEKLEDFLLKLLNNDFGKYLSFNVIEALASEIVREESNTSSPGNLIRWIHTHRQILHNEFLNMLVNKVANLYSDLIVYSDKDLKPKESNFLSFFSKCLYNDMYDEVEDVMNKVILEMMGEERVRFDIENVLDFRLYSNLIKNAESFSRDVSYYNIDNVDEEEILKTYLELHDRLREEMGLSNQEDESEEILVATVKISDIIKKFQQ